jgi:hypothetical protein
VIETVLQQATTRGAALNNCYQTHDGLWRANFREVKSKAGAFGCPWGSGATMEVALVAALANVPEPPPASAVSAGDLFE